MKWFKAKGAVAADLRQRKFALTRQFQIPDNLLPGSLVVTYRRCGKPTCHCIETKGHPMWQLTFMVDGKKRVEAIPKQWAEDLLGLVEQGREFKRAVAEVLAINAQLLALYKQQGKKKK
ncbi:MAG: hypothetical protein GY847_09545 [Proteobacteria bacterium]|nr:hypothetical protein [Pseudomonadota bacterium]